MMITRLYTLFLGLLIAVFVGVGIAAFYHAPKAPDYLPPARTASGVPTDPAQDKAYQDATTRYDAARQAYDRNVSLLALGAALILVTLGLSLLAPIAVLGDSLLLGGIFTLAYGTIRGFGTDDINRFLIVSASLAVAIAISYLKFIRPHQSGATPRSK
jgi:uncharacterized membrane protein